jgi:hypothetical protein
VDISVDTALVEAAAQRADAASARLRELAAESSHLGGIVHEPVVAQALAGLSDVVADACEGVALDLAMIARRLRAGATVYDATESGLADWGGSP